MSSKQRCRISLPISIDCDEDYDCGEGIGSGECCEALLAGQERIISGQDQIIKLLSQMKDCVCDCGGGVTPEPGYKGDAIGVILPESGRKSGTSLYRIDKDIENVDSVSADYFNKHPLWSGIVSEVIDGQTMVKIPAFAYKRGVATSGTNAGKKYLILAPADTTEPGFERHPAFMKDGQPIDSFWVGAYQACVDPANANKLGSVAGTMPVVSINQSTASSKIQARNSAPVSGFMMWSIYQLAAIQMLYLVEYADTDSQVVIGSGNTTTSSIRKVDESLVASSNYRGLIGLWGNVCQWVDGARVNAAKKVEIWKRDGSQSYSAQALNIPACTAPIYMTVSATANTVDCNFNDVFLPEATSASVVDSLYSDGFWGYHDVGWCIVGGSYNHGELAGIFLTSFATPASPGHVNVGTRIAKI